MAVTITGGKYSGAITSAGTLTLTNSGASFVAGDFSVQRIVGLWNSAGTTYKGVAWIRARTSGTVLELKTPFIDKDGSTVTQVVGDTYLVSKNYADSATSGIAVSGNLITLTDNLIFGTNGVSNAVCFYDQNKTIICHTSGSEGMDFRGGLIVHGHLEDYATRSISGGCVAYTNSANSRLLVRDTQSKVWWLGGSIVATATPFYLPAAGDFGAGVADWQKWWGVNCFNVDIVGQYANGTIAARQEIADLTLVASGNNSILQRWNGAVLGQFIYRLVGTDVLGVFGSDSPGTFTRGTTDALSIVRDAGIGSKMGLWRSGALEVQTINYRNIVTSNRKQTTGTSGGPNNNATGNHRFYGNFTGLQNGTLGLIKNNSIRSDVENSGTVSGSTITLEVLEAVVAGHTETVRESSWLYGFYKYGYSLVSNNFTVSTLDTGSGPGKVVLFNPTDEVRTVEFIGQIIDVNITQPTVATVAAYTTITTSDQLYDYAQYFKALNTTNAIFPTVDTQLISNTGGVLSSDQNIVFDSAAGSVFSGSTTITIKAAALTAGTKSSRYALAAGKSLQYNQAGDKSGFPIDVPATGEILVSDGATDLSGSTFVSGAEINLRSGATAATVTVSPDQLANITAGAGVTLAAPVVEVTLTNLVAGSEVRIYETGTQAEVAGNEAVNGTTFAFQPTGAFDIRIFKAGFQVFRSINNAVPSTDQSIQIAQLIDRGYSDAP